ncbi:NmrA family NAD(P)-binding protein [Sodalis sp. dw_96]|uniref:NmrA family NAD(P)-binding protein n=1 Tax=Sodalis sp. dw_96 TaxID=2719794 RepID=UPI001BD472AA|nr:NmrA family NAD(P)-binding protein [Sodalis sp. dw_96]
MIRVTIAGGTWAAVDKLAGALAGQGVRVRVLTENPLRARENYDRGNVEYMAIHLEDPLSLRVAFQDTDRAFLAGGDRERPSRYDLALIDAAVRAEVPYLVNLSEGGGCVGQSARLWQSETDIHLAAQGVTTTRIHPALSLDAVFAVAAQFVPPGLWGGTASSGQAALVDLRDVVSAVARILLEGAEGHGGKIYHLNGPAAVTMGYIADYLAENLSRRVRYHHRGEDEQRTIYQQAGLLTPRIDALLEQDNLIRHGFYADTSADLFDLNHRPARTAIAWIKEHRGDFSHGQ